MRIGIDYRLPTGRWKQRGMARYVQNIVQQLLLLDDKNEYYLIIDDQIEEIKNVTLIKSAISDYILGEQFLLPYYTVKYKFDVLWCPGNTFPFFLRKKTKLVVTIHDLIFLDKNQSHNSTLSQKIGRLYRKYNLMLGKKRINKAISVSNYSARLIEGLINKNVYVVPNNISHFLDTKNEFDESILEYLNILHQSYFFTVSGNTPSKNLSTILNVFSNTNVNEKIVIVGVSPNDNKNVKNDCKKIIFAPRVSDGQLKALYKNAKGFIFLSLAEGFGIPILEAMVYNLPIIASNRCAIPEILEEAGILLDPMSADEIINTICSFDSINWKVYSVKQQEQLNKFSSWKNSAEKILAIFNDL